MYGVLSDWFGRPREAPQVRAALESTPRFVNMNGGDTMGAMRLRLSLTTRLAARSLVLLAIAVAPADSQGPTIEKTLLAIQGSIQAGHQAEAMQQIEAAIARFPKAGGFYNLRGVIHAQREELTQARTDFQQAVKLSPGLTPAWQNLARACQLAPGQDAEAVACAVSAWQRVLLARPADVEARSSLATVYEWQGKFAESLHELGRLPESETARASLVALQCGDLAGLGRTREALAAARKLVQSPDFSEADAGSIFPVLRSKEYARIVIVLVEDAGFAWRRLSHQPEASGRCLRTGGTAGGRAQDLGARCGARSGERSASV